MLTNVDGVSQTGGVVQIDNKFFVNCKFERCELIYTGGDVGWANCSFVDCPIKFNGDAQRTINLLQSFGFEVTKKENNPPKQSSNLGFIQ